MKTIICISQNPQKTQEAYCWVCTFIENNREAMEKNRVKILYSLILNQIQARQILEAKFKHVNDFLNGEIDEDTVHALLEDKDEQK